MEFGQFLTKITLMPTPESVGLAGKVVDLEKLHRYEHLPARGKHRTPGLRGTPKGLQRDSSGSLVGLLWVSGVRGTPVGLRWDSRGTPRDSEGLESAVSPLIMVHMLFEYIAVYYQNIYFSSCQIQKFASTFAKTEKFHSLTISRRHIP